MKVTSTKNSIHDQFSKYDKPIKTIGNNNNGMNAIVIAIPTIKMKYLASEKNRNLSSQNALPA